MHRYVYVFTSNKKNIAPVDWFPPENCISMFAILSVEERNLLEGTMSEEDIEVILKTFRPMKVLFYNKPTDEIVSEVDISSMNIEEVEDLIKRHEDHVPIFVVPEKNLIAAAQKEADRIYVELKMDLKEESGFFSKLFQARITLLLGTPVEIDGVWYFLYDLAEKEPKDDNEYYLVGVFDAYAG